MAVDFAQDSVTYKAKREYAPVSTINAFLTLAQAWTNATSSGFSERAKNDKSVSLTGVKNVKEIATGNVYCTFKVVSKRPGVYPSVMSGIHSAFPSGPANSSSEGGMGLPEDTYIVEEDVGKRNWKMTLTGTYDANGDKVTLALDESYAWLTYHTPEALAGMEAWADSQTDLSAEPTA